VASPGNPFRAAWCGVVACVVFSACCVRPPLTEEWLDVGFREPDQAVKTFQTAVRADSSELEYRCFSSGFRERNHISRMTWAEARAQLREKYPWMRRGISDMELEGDLRRAGQRVEGTWVTHGRRIRIALVREDYAELWSGKQLLKDDAGVDFAKHTLVQRDAESNTWFYGYVQMPFGPETPDVTEVHVGREWKIDGFDTVEDGTVVEDGDTGGGKANSHQEPQ
jgi:hypothetical protein